MEKAIEVKGVLKSFKDTEVLKGIDFEVKRGEVFALLGSNGAGKTTIVKILTTLIKQDGGTAVVNGFDVAAKPDYVRQSISLTGKFASVDEILTGRENLIMIAKLKHLINPRQVVYDLLNRFGLTNTADPRVSTYSGGMRRRLDIAMSLEGKPELIFLDEPTALIMCFNSPTGIHSWLAVAGILALFTLALTWIAIIAGLSAKSVDGAGAFAYPLIFLPFISSAFVSTKSMPSVVRAFAENQPVTSIVDAIRALLANQPVGSDIWAALAWCAGIMVIAYLFAMKVYRSRV